MRKLISLFLIAAMCLSVLTGCGSAAEDPAEQTTEAVPTTEPAPTTTEDDLSLVEDMGKIEADEGLLSVTLTLPAALFEGEEDFDLDAWVKENGYLDASWLEDGSVSLTLSKAKHREVLRGMAESLEVTFGEMVEAEDTPYIKEITHSENFDQVTVKVIRADYENTWDLTPFVIGINVRFYQAFLDMDYHVEISMVDADTGETISTTVYPDDLQ